MSVSQNDNVVISYYMSIDPTIDVPVMVYIYTGCLRYRNWDKEQWVV